MKHGLGPLAAVAGALVVALLLAGFGNVLRRIDEGRVDAAAARRELAEVRAELERLRDRAMTITSRQADDLELCRLRTENLRAVLEVLIPSGVWPERVRLPDPPPGWRAWPEGNRNGYDTRPEEP